jgi:hypothetical protein
MHSAVEHIYVEKYKWNESNERPLSQAPVSANLFVLYINLNM